jgi:hypothetical protein
MWALKTFPYSYFMDFLSNLDEIEDKYINDAVALLN